jgi:hypothetical protein
MKKKDHTKAIDDLNKSLELNPKSISALMRRA